jgi:hypothetical protein
MNYTHRLRRDGGGQKWSLTLRIGCVAAAGMLGALLARTAYAQTTWPERTGQQPLRVIIPLHPSAPQTPDLQYHLLPRASDMHAGNAALGYAAAVEMIPPDRTAAEADELETLRTEPLADLDEKAAKKLLANYDHALRQLRLAARYDYVDWQTDVFNRGLDAPLPSLSFLRQLSNVLTVAIRLDLKHRDFAAAVEKLQTGFALARHTGEGHALIQTLVGAAIAGAMTREVEEWIGIDGSPNLFWPLAYMPRPLLDMPRALAFEKDAAYLSIPELRQMRAHPLTADGWTRFVAGFQSASSGGDVEPPKTYEQQLQATGLALMIYPSAKQYLIERQHLSPEDVDKMPVAEMLGRYFPDSFDASMDRTFRYVNLPPAVALPALRKAERDFGQPGGMYTNLLARIFLPSLDRAIFITANTNRTLDALEAVEGVRAYAAEHHELPANLAAMGLPIPNDPMTARPFDYRVENGGVTITSVPLEDPAARDTLIYQLTGP